MRSTLEADRLGGVAGADEVGPQEWTPKPSSTVRGRGAEGLGDDLAAVEPAPRGSSDRCRPARRRRGVRGGRGRRSPSAASAGRLSGDGGNRSACWWCRILHRLDGAVARRRAGGRRRRRGASASSLPVRRRRARRRAGRRRFLLLTPARFGAVAGLTKDLFERIYPWFERGADVRPGLPWTMVARGQRTRPAPSVTWSASSPAFRWKQVLPPIAGDRRRHRRRPGRRVRTRRRPWPPASVCRPVVEPAIRRLGAAASCRPVDDGAAAERLRCIPPACGQFVAQAFTDSTAGRLVRLRLAADAGSGCR